MGTPELSVEKRYFITQQERGLHTLVGDIGAINSGNSDVSVPDATRKIEPKRAGTPGIGASKADSNVHIRNRASGQAAGSQSCIHKAGYSGPEWASAPPSLQFCRLVRKDACHAVRAKTFTCRQNRVRAQQ
jgi:hypothetical protein